MARPKEKVLVMLREQMDLLRTSLRAFYEGNFAESLRIATTIRILVHESGMSKPLLKQARPDGLALQIQDICEARPGEEEVEEVFNFAVGVRMGPGPTVAPAVDLGSSHYTLNSIGAWWNRTVLSFPSNGTQMIYTRKKVVLILANTEGGAHVDPDEDADYVKLLTDQPLTFDCDGVQIKTPDLARFLTAQSGVEMLECLKRNFFPDVNVPPKWEFGEAPPIATYFDQVSGRFVMRLASEFPTAKMVVTRRD